MIVQPTEEALARAAEIIRNGGLVAFPTETVYGLGANALDARAVGRIYEAKGRPFASPLIVHVADEAMARSLAANWPEAARKLAERFWPGPLTLVVKKAAVVPDTVSAGLDSVGLRVPAHPVALALIRKAAVPIAAPSANRFMQISPTTAEHVNTGLGNRVDLILDGGATRVGIESTVASLRRDPPAVLRPGMISQEELEAVTGRAWDRELELPHISESPGLHARHYAPRTPFYVLEVGAPRPAGRGHVIQMPSRLNEYAARLYLELHKADKEGWDWIAVEKPPETSEWTGILDRLRRASAK
ncbi:MAG: threonylcarbamoyl-AMP synthase [Acidobacteriaceae bacterium]|nr:threonylcarbamoyl-AMP synthase [Acidobacteriaceae bacterium]MBV9503166.1 threonylcarbamoyl-AMP synthase [Acidobacteriaceae bacterium]